MATLFKVDHFSVDGATVVLGTWATLDRCASGDAPGFNRTRFQSAQSLAAQCGLRKPALEDAISKQGPAFEAPKRWEWEFSRRPDSLTHCNTSKKALQTDT